MLKDQRRQHEQLSSSLDLFHSTLGRKSRNIAYFMTTLQCSAVCTWMKLGQCVSLERARSFPPVIGREKCAGDALPGRVACVCWRGKIKLSICRAFLNLLTGYQMMSSAGRT